MYVMYGKLSKKKFKKKIHFVLWERCDDFTRVFK